MDRVFKSGASATPPAPPVSPSVGYPIGGDPGTGTPATKPGAYWYHMITESLRRLLVASGLTPDHTNLDQVTLAVQEMIRQAAGDYKPSVRAATTANIAALNGGAPNTLDGVTLVAGDRILVKDQTTASQNGLYVITTLGTGANGTWTRAADADATGELTSGAVVAVEEGSFNIDTQWILVTDGVITIGTTPLTFVKQGAVGQQVGEVCYFARATAPVGFVKANGGTIGSAASGATLRASAEMLALFTLLWGEFSNSILAIQDSAGAASTRGASAAADFAANKRLPVLDLRGEFVRGLDDSRGVDAGRVNGSGQSYMTESHVHGGSYNSFNDRAGGAGGTPNLNSGGTLSNTSAFGGTETRPRNVALLACIKY
ncbi:hypothetical protein [Rhodoferax sp. TS-BS-61-7]|uniref:hypothetical protein n=1 Tax=Rhodoferax sp. TS-BS-61-7 TaxID=2094194 RepID=UPI000CF64431|nr:hypothetical protein [Rhodoferax sp. TS-BS-61-7]PQA78678.1 hypothetical protein C5F53_01490 [Rhodoferax sp. TS-BS-61-7]